MMLQERLTWELYDLGIHGIYFWGGTHAMIIEPHHPWWRIKVIYDEPQQLPDGRRVWATIS